MKKIQPRRLATASLLLGTLAAACTLSGCDAVFRWLDDLAAQSDPEPPPPQTAVEAPEGALPERPPSSTARSETDVISFRTVLENQEMTREERIRAFQNLDPGALQKPVARANVSGGPTAARTREPSRDREPADYELAAARRRVPVVMYSTAWCGVCKRARKYFEEKRIAFEELDVDEDANARAEYVLLNPRRSVPTIKIGDEVVVGFSAAAVERALDSEAKSRLN